MDVANNTIVAGGSGITLTDASGSPIAQAFLGAPVPTEGGFSMEPSPSGEIDDIEISDGGLIFVASNDLVRVFDLDGVLFPGLPPLDAGNTD